MNFAFLTTATQDVDAFTQLMVTFGPIALMLVVFYFIMLRPQQKREKATQDMRSAIEVGDDIITIGGIIGTVVSVKEDNIVIETSGDRNKIRVTRWAIQQNTTPKEDGAK